MTWSCELPVMHGIEEVKWIGSFATRHELEYVDEAEEVWLRVVHRDQIVGGLVFSLEK